MGRSITTLTLNWSTRLRFRVKERRWKIQLLADTDTEEDLTLLLGFGRRGPVRFIYPKK